VNDNSPSKPGTLFLVATPIGNLDDITLRALKVFKTVDVIAAEDTRRTRKLLSFFDIHANLISFREHNRVYQGKKLLERLKSGKNVALCSDAGMPLISDPGEDFVSLCICENIPITVVPGPNAAISALVISGIPANTFLYLGFIPRKSTKRTEFLESIADEPHTLIFYESPARVVELLKDLQDVLGERKACAVREITKFHEEAIRGDFTDLITKMEGKELKGEFTIVVEGASPQSNKGYFDPDTVVCEAKKMMSEGTSKKNISKKLAQKYHTSVRAIYQLLIESTF
jgi:16S rRNA (cytidine1402-2'-O)-methyltransferase